MPKVSVIVTVYNAGSFLRRCLDSLASQTLSDVEFVLVLDCPTDGSDKIAKEYAAKDKRFIIIENGANLHIGESRNVGLKIAKGDYITFMDHDDFCDICMLETLYNKAIEEKSDIVISPIRRYFESSKSFLDRQIELPAQENPRIYVLKQIILRGTSNKVHFSFNQIHGILYKKSFLDEGDIRNVDTKRILPEDSLFNISCLIKPSVVTIVNQSFYSHVTNEVNTGATLSYFDWNKRLLGYKYEKELLCNSGLYYDYEHLFKIGVVRSCNFLFLHQLTLGSFHQCLKVLNSARHEKLIKDAYKIKDSAVYPLKIAFVNFLFKTVMKLG